MSTVDQESLDLSAFGWAAQPTRNTYVAPTNSVDAQDFDFPANVNNVIFTAMRRSRDTKNSVRRGAGTLMGTLTSDFYLNQGIGLWRRAIGFAAFSAATTETYAASGPAAAATTATLSALPALPSGIGSWVDGWVDLGSGATFERKLIQKVSGAVISFTPCLHDHTGDANASFPAQNFIQTYTGAQVSQTDLLSACLQFGQLREYQISDGRVTDIKLAITDEKITEAIGITFSPPDFPASIALATTIPYATGEGSDVVTIAQDGGLILRYSASDTLGTMHGRLLSANYTLQNTNTMRKYGGGVQKLQIPVLGARSQAFDWTEDAGENDAVADIYNAFVLPEVETEAFCAYVNHQSNQAFGLWFPRVKVTEYTEVKAGLNQVVGSQGKLEILPDVLTTGLSVKLSVVNGLTAVIA